MADFAAGSPAQPDTLLAPSRPSQPPAEETTPDDTVIPPYQFRAREFVPVPRSPVVAAAGGEGEDLQADGDEGDLRHGEKKSPRCALSARSRWASAQPGVCRTAVPVRS